MTIAIIPARGGSKRIPRKNIRPFCGQPMIRYAIQAALAAGDSLKDPAAYVQRLNKLLVELSA